MKLSVACPISNKKINQHVARLNAIFTILLIVTFAVTQNIIPIVFLLVDFLLRTSDYSQYSLIAITSKNIVKYLHLKKVFMNAGPKIFAARIGFIFTILITTAYFLNSTNTAFIIAAVLALFSFLESVFGFCVACKIYPFVYMLLKKKS